MAVSTVTAPARWVAPAYGRRTDAGERRPMTGSTRSSSARGPNGLAAAIELARAGRSVRIYEAADTVGGGVRSAELTLPGFVHDPCCVGPPASLASPLFRALALERHGLEWVHPDAPVAHALAPGRSVVLAARARGGRTRRGPGTRRRRLAPHLRRRWSAIGNGSCRCSSHPSLRCRAIRCSWHASVCRRLSRPSALARLAFREPATRALFAGMAAHSMLPLHAPLSASFGLVLGLLAHAVGWPVARGGSGAIGAALEAEARALGCGDRDVAPGGFAGPTCLPARAYVLDLTPRQVLEVAGDRLPAGYRRRLEGFRYGPGVFKVDWALDGPDPVGRPRDGPGGNRPSRRPDARDRRVRSGGAAGAGMQTGRSCSLSSRRSRTRHVPPRASTSPGRTATCPTARRST